MKENKTIEMDNIHQSVSRSTKYMFVKLKGVIRKVTFDDIYYIKGAEDYSEIYFKAHRLVVTGSIGQIEKHLPKETFFKCHRSNIVNLDKIDQISGDFISSGNYIIKISSGNKSELLQLLNYTILGSDENNLEKKKEE